MQEIYRDDQLREQLKLQGTVMFESHTNLPQPSETSIENDIEHMSITEPKTSHTGRSRAEGSRKR
jgi:hypothetical protein